MKNMDLIGIVVQVYKYNISLLGKHFNSYVSYESKRYMFFYEG